MRVVQVSHDMAAIGRLFSPVAALEAARERRGRTYDPELADLFAVHGSSWFDRLAKMEPWDAALDLEPEPHRYLDGAELDDALSVGADFIEWRRVGPLLGMNPLHHAARRACVGGVPRRDARTRKQCHAAAGWWEHDVRTGGG
jgi:hypothetical protein